MESQKMIEAYIANTRAEIDAWAVSVSTTSVTWETDRSEGDMFIERDGAGQLWLWKESIGHIAKFADDTTLPELLTVCRVLGIPLEVEGAK